MQAALDGKEIEVRNYPYEDGCRWNAYSTEMLVWNWPNVDYRIKPEPMEFWVNIYNYPTDTPFGTHKTKAQAIDSASDKVIKTIKMREVLDD